MLEILFALLVAAVVLVFLPFFISFVLPLAILSLMVGLLWPLAGFLIFAGGIFLAVLFITLVALGG